MHALHPSPPSERCASGSEPPGPRPGGQQPAPLHAAAHSSACTGTPQVPSIVTKVCACVPDSVPPSTLPTAVSCSTHPPASGTHPRRALTPPCPHRTPCSFVPPLLCPAGRCGHCATRGPRQALALAAGRARPGHARRHAEAATPRRRSQAADGRHRGVNVRHVLLGAQVAGGVGDQQLVKQVHSLGPRQAARQRKQAQLCAAVRAAVGAAGRGWRGRVLRRRQAFAEDAAGVWAGGGGSARGMLSAGQCRQGNVECGERPLTKPSYPDTSIRHCKSATARRLTAGLPPRTHPRTHVPSCTPAQPPPHTHTRRPSNTLT